MFDTDAWSILSDIELSIKNKIEAAGTPLKDWKVDIFRGVLTGCNDAFIISSEKRDEILANCANEPERQRTAAIIRPILRGRDIKRYGYVFAEQYLIATFPAKQYDIDDYPALKYYLLAIGIERLEQTGKEHVVNGERVKARKKTNNKWFETQDSISYWDLLSQPKIIWGEISDKTKFCLDRKGEYVPEATTFMLSGDNLTVLLAFLNCSVSEYMFSTIGTTTGVGTVRWKKFKIERLFVPRNIDEDTAKAIEAQCERIISITAQQGSSPEEESVLNHLIYRFYGLSDSEIRYIENQVR
ncbi:MAG: class I SAM-dependent DNA methyltransferase [Bacteroidales bacterium]|nr:class I SAM-dependent DNA methyltransferase [Bacteroidales bacterium]